MVTDFGGIDEAFSVAIQSDGKIVMTGTADMGTGGPYDFAVVRYGTEGVTPPPVPGVGWPGLLALAFGFAALGSLFVIRRARAARAG